MSESSKSKYFTYEDGEGHVFIADKLEDIPKKYRELAKEISIEEAADKLSDLHQKASKKLADAKRLKGQSLKKAKKVQREVGDVIPFVQELDLPSVAVGFALSLIFLLVLSVVKRTGKLILKLAMFVVIVCLLVGAYFGWLRKAAGLGDARISTPGQVIDDAKKAAGQFQDRLDRQEKTLKEIEENETK